MTVILIILILIILIMLLKMKKKVIIYCIIAIAIFVGAVLIYNQAKMKKHENQSVFIESVDSSEEMDYSWVKGKWDLRTDAGPFIYVISDSRVNVKITDDLMMQFTYECEDDKMHMRSITNGAEAVFNLDLDNHVIISADGIRMRKISDSY